MAALKELLLAETTVAVMEPLLAASRVLSMAGLLVDLKADRSADRWASKRVERSAA
jgi:hypothetical protein